MIGSGMAASIVTCLPASGPAPVSKPRAPHLYAPSMGGGSWSPEGLRMRVAARPSLSASVALWAATMLGFIAIGAVLPILPAYVRGPVGAGDLAVGVVVGCFAFAAVIGRPVGGRLADAHGRRLIVVSGLVIA